MLIASNKKVIIIALEYKITGRLKNSQFLAHPNPLALPSSVKSNSGLLYNINRAINIYTNIDNLTGHFKIEYIYYLMRFFVKKINSYFFNYLKLFSNFYLNYFISIIIP